MGWLVCLVIEVGVAEALALHQRTLQANCRFLVPGWISVAEPEVAEVQPTKLPIMIDLLLEWSRAFAARVFSALPLSIHW